MDEWDDWVNSDEFKKLSHLGIKELRRKQRYMNRYNIYSCAVSTVAIIIALASLIVSIISLVTR